MSNATITPEEERLLQGQTLYYVATTWRSRPGETTSFRYGPFLDADKAKAEQRAGLRWMGYTPPRWWQWWRWSEYRYEIDFE